MKKTYKQIRVEGSPLHEHRLVAERILGHALPIGAVIHHINEDRSDNRPENLVICQDRAYHNLLHARLRALDACGNPNYRPCVICREYDAPSRMRQNARTGGYRHAACHAHQERTRRRASRTR